MNITLIINFIDAIGHNVLALLKYPQISFYHFWAFHFLLGVFSTAGLLVFTDLSLGT